MRSSLFRSRLTVWTIIACGVMGIIGLRADDAPQDDATALAAAINEAVAARLSEAEIAPAPGIDDAHFLRRVTLDLAGRIPTPAEQAAFQSDESPDKRARLVDRLTASPDFAFHQRNEINRHLLGSQSAPDAWNNYVLAATRENRPWDRIFREIILPEREDAADSGAGEFLRRRAKDLDNLTNDVAVLLFGVNVSCAKCHDHPLVDDWKQDHYFGLASFFQRTYPTQSGLVAEKFDGRLRFTTVEGEEKQAAFLFLSGDAVDEPAFEWSDEDRKTTEEAVAKAEKEADAPAPPLPDFSPRSELVRMALDQGADGFLARSYANRIWARLIGHGLVHPVDQMHSGNPASHPELLAALAADFVEHDYDTRRLIRAIVLSDVYSRDSHWTDGERPAREFFAVANVRPLTPRQIALSLDIATSAPDSIAAAPDGDAWAAQREQLENRSAGIATNFELPEEHFQVSVDEALLFSNGSSLANDYLKADDDRLVGILAKAAEPDEAATTAFTSVLARLPDDAERAAVAQYIEERRDRTEDGLRQVVWALLASPEFRFNH